MNKWSIALVVILGLGCIQQKEEIQVSDLGEDLACIFAPDMPDSIVVTSQEEYETLLEYRADSPACRNAVLPHIDFSEHTLLGKYTTGSGCSVTFEKHVYRDAESKKIIYTITIVEEGNCEMMAMSMNWITIPAVPPGYTVVFQVHEK
jgi:hypothetical protein